MTAAYWQQPISEQVTAVGDGATTSAAQGLGVRDEITRREPELLAWVCLTDEPHLDAGDGGGGPLDGVSVGVKDLIDVAGLPTRAGSAVTPEQAATADAPCVARFRELGAVIQGKTVTTEFGYFAPGPTRNPHNLEHTPGGSSSGSAAAVGAGTIPIALGTQTAGSLARPASYCGAAGVVLAHGTTDLAGVTGLSESLDSLGLLARTVADLHYVFSAFTTGAAPAEVPAAPLIRQALIWHGSGLHAIDPSMHSLLKALPDLLETLSVSAEPLEWDDHIQTLADDHITVMAYEAARTLNVVYDGHSERLSEPLRRLVEDGRVVSADDHAGALIRRDRSRELLAGILAEDTVVVGPAAPGAAPKGLSATGSPVLSRPWQLLGAPVVVVPGARDGGGLPLGVQLIGKPGREEALFDLGTRLEPLLRALPAQDD